ncbi:amidase [Piscinibacter gummiphilus]|uniref:Amidase n=1 Tax=Piscinibacter gummiphilus TaxID=946333 RepID=A0ABZ0D1Q9_9BURK|nr:amidase [Piscinibacter gummiphilus]WOB10686.1 amidase [Piscinibacter gummiphilus]
MTNDLTAARAALLQGRTTAAEALAASLQSAESAANTRTYLTRFDAQAMAAAHGVDRLHAAGAPLPALAGLAVSVKALFDVQGYATTAASRVLADAPVAQADCPAVARLRAAGASLTGHTNMTEFAFSGVGLNPHYGTPPNAATLALDAEPRIPGGSTSGGAVSVASSAAWAALGSDTGGSIRIPAALQGLVGFKNTARLTPTEGAIPLSTTLDTACAITRSVRDAVLLHEVLAARRVSLPGRPVSALRLAVPTSQLEGLDDNVARAFERSLGTLRQAGAQIETLALPELAELTAINATGGFSAAESWAWHRQLLSQRQADYDPRVALRIHRGETMSAADYLDLTRARADWIARMTLTMRRYDALLSPTVPIVAPTIASLTSDDAFFATNALLLRNPSVVNMLDGCALSLPCHTPDELPVGLMVWSHALQDDAVLDASLAIEATLAKGRS